MSTSPTRTAGQAAGCSRSCPNLRRANELDGWISDVAKERDRYRDALWECMKAAGADTSYADSAAHAAALARGKLGDEAIEAVLELRRDYGDLPAVGA